MRISTSMMFSNGTHGIQDRQSDLFRVQNQLSTGRRILTPEDDPIGASEVLKVSQSKAANSQYLNNQSIAQTSLGALDNVLGTVSDELTRITELAAGGNNATLGPAERRMIAMEMKDRLQDLIGLANTEDGTGLYIFGGYQSTTPPFAENTGAPAPHDLMTANTSVIYSGDAGKQAVQVTASKDMNINENGLDVFMQVKDASGNVIGRSMFDSIQNMIDQLDSSSGVPASTAAFNQALSDIKSGISHVATIRASVGARRNALESLTSAGEDVKFNYDARLSALQDLDYTEAISRFSAYKMQLDAAQLTFKQTSQMSLFNIL